MKLGNLKIFYYTFLLFFIFILRIYAEDKIESVPLINLEDLSDDILKRIFYYGIMKKDMICKTIYRFFEKNNLFV